MRNRGNTTLIIVLIVLVILGIAWYNSSNYKAKTAAIDTFAECAARGYQVTATYPRQCIMPSGQVYAENALSATAYNSLYSNPVAYNAQPAVYDMTQYRYSVPTQLAYIQIPIAKSSATSQPTQYYTPQQSYSYSYSAPQNSASSASSSYYYYASNPSSSSSSYYYQNSSPMGAGGGCYVGGCSNQLCSDRPGQVSTCEYRPEYACYQNARCERQATGQCGWTQTVELYSCLSNSF